MRPFAAIPGIAMMLAASMMAAEQVHIDSGAIEGATSADGTVRIYKGIPYAAPPVGDLRWKPPQPVAAWTGVRQATEFGARCAQGRIYDDMVFRDKGPSEDCLYLNVWAPLPPPDKKPMPVMVWIHGGGFVAGASSEPRQDGENLAHKGVIVVSMNYRLGVFGFLAHPELTRESDHNASGNYGLRDQVAALQWVHRNIEAFGGNPYNVTIFGESAGSMSVSALLATPLTDQLIEKAIGESGASFGTLSAVPRLIAETKGTEFAKQAGAKSLAELRAKSTDEILQVSLKPDPFRFAADIDGYFLPEPVGSLYKDEMESHVPLLAGWNANEGGADEIFEKDKPTAKNFVKRVKALYPLKADEVLKVYPASNDQEAIKSAGDLAGDRFIAYATWKWIEMHLLTSKSPVYRYQFDQAPPQAAGAKGGSPGAYHSAEIEFVFNVLPSKNLPWRPEDTKLADLMSSYWTNFAKTGDPNGPGLPKWPQYTADDHYPVMHLSATPAAEPDGHRDRYLVLDAPYGGK